jgi:hypothetical protein
MADRRSSSAPVRGLTVILMNGKWCGGTRKWTGIDVRLQKENP